MKRIVSLSLLLLLLCANLAHARLFWQTYGSTVPAGDGCGCRWNLNQDYFVPRHTTTCRYNLWSPCKTACTRSPACFRCHPFYPGYCGIYGSWHYHHKDHVYRAYCGCSPYRLPCPLHPRRRPCCVPLQMDGCTNCFGAAMPEYALCGTRCPLPNVEAPEFHRLGSIPVKSDDLLATIGLVNQDDDRDADDLQSVPVTPAAPALPSLGAPVSVPSASASEGP